MILIGIFSFRARADVPRPPHAISIPHAYFSRAFARVFVPSCAPYGTSSSTRASFFFCAAAVRCKTWRSRGEAHAVTRVHAQSTEGALFRLEHHDETVARVARRTFVQHPPLERARARARDAADLVLIVLLVLRAWYRVHYFHPIRAHTSNDTYMHRVRILTLSNPVYVHTRAHRGRTLGRVPARSRVDVARPRTLDAARRAAEARRRTIARGHRPWS